MQSPEVWNFKEPSTFLQIKEFNKFPKTLLEEFFCNHLITLIVPDCLKIPPKLVQSLIDDCEYYKITGVNLSHLLDPQFFDNFIRQGKLTALSIGTRIDCDNCFAITPTGTLILILNKDTYQSLGLEGSASYFSQKNKDRYIIKIDLRNSKLQPGQRSFKRIKAALDSLEKFSLILSWLPPEDTICPSSVAKFFNDLNYNVKVCKNNFKTHVLYSINSPIILKEDISENEIIDFAEWLGMVSIDGDFLGSFDNYVNTYEAPEPSIVLSQLRFLQWRGFFLPEHIEKLTSFLR